MRINNIVAALAASLLLASCGHTNKLAKYNVRSATFEMYSGTNTLGNASSSVYAGGTNPVGDILAGISSQSLSDETAEKLRRAANADSLASRIARQFNTALTTYLAVSNTSPSNSNPLFRAETQLTAYSLTSDSTGINAYISATSRIIQRSTGTVVWEYTSSKNVALSQTSSSQASGRAMLSAVNAATLAHMSEADMAAVFYGAAQEVGSDIAETLRKDVADMATK